MLKLNFNRYKAEEFLTKFKATTHHIEDGEAAFLFQIDGEDLYIFLPLENGVIVHSLVIVAEEVLANIQEFDNQVQQSCAEECLRTGHHARNYELYLAYIRIFLEYVELRYYGLRVNTEWSAIFKKSEVGWKKENF